MHSIVSSASSALTISPDIIGFCYTHYSYHTSHPMLQRIPPSIGHFYLLLLFISYLQHRDWDFLLFLFPPFSLSKYVTTNMPFLLHDDLLYDICSFGNLPSFFVLVTCWHFCYCLGSCLMLATSFLDDLFTFVSVFICIS